MALTIRHAFISDKPEGTDPTVVRPSNWNASHVVTGTIDEAGLALTDVTMANASTAKHGFVPKLPNDESKFLNGIGTFTEPVRSDDITGLDSLLFTETVFFDFTDFETGHIQHIVLTGDVTSMSAIGLTGQLVTFIIEQDEVGSHTWEWDANMIGAAAIGTFGSRSNIQTFRCINDNTFVALGPMLTDLEWLYSVSET